jgi:hypothetical protein
LDNIKVEEFCLLESNACRQLNVNRNFVDFSTDYTELYPRR